ncbi:MAG: O-antigen ligase family protein [Bacteroidaceae bacterium]
MLKNLMNLFNKYYISLMFSSVAALLYIAVVVLGIKMALILSLIPFILAIVIILLNYPQVALISAFILNYFIMGLTRYIDFKAGAVNLIVVGTCLVLILLKSLVRKTNTSSLNNFLVLFLSIGVFIHIIYLFRPIQPLLPWFLHSGINVIYPLITVISIQIFFKTENGMKYFMIIWGILTFFGAVKGWYQYSRGFDSYEWRWLLNGGSVTHFINSGVRYFSFFTDAAAYGTSMALSMVCFAFCTLYEKHWLLKIFYIGVTFCGLYGLLISGTRSAFAVPAVAILVFVFLMRKWTLIIISLTLMISAFTFLRYTDIGDSNRFISRTRTATRWETDPSFQVRMQNQETLRKVMSDYPFGIGLGLSNHRGARWNQIPTPAKYATDSWLVAIWVEMGEPGLVFFLLMCGSIILSGSYILLHYIRDPELIGYLSAFIATYTGGIAGAYSNEVLGFPNTFLIYGCIAFVFIGKELNCEITERKKRGKKWKLFNII